MERNTISIIDYCIHLVPLEAKLQECKEGTNLSSV